MLSKECGGFEIFHVLEYNQIDENRNKTISHRSQLPCPGKDHRLPMENSPIQSDKSAAVGTFLKIFVHI